MLGKTRSIQHLQKVDNVEANTHTAGTQRRTVCVSVFLSAQRGVWCMCEVSSPTKRTPADSSRSEVSGSLWAMPRKRTASRSESVTCAGTFGHVCQILIYSAGVLPVPPTAPITGLSSLPDWLSGNLPSATWKHTNMKRLVSSI